MANGRGMAGWIQQIEQESGATHISAPAGANTLVPIHLSGNPNPALLDRSRADYELNRLAIDVLSRVGAPAYFEVGEDSVIRNVLVPRVGRVIHLAPGGADELRVGIDGSAIALKVRTSTDDGRERAALLRESQDLHTRLVVTVDARSNEIVHVRRSDEVELPAGEPPPGSVTIGAGAISEIPEVDPTTSEAVFRQIAAESCEPLNPALGCIPFRFARDGCWVRAHQMCKFLEAQPQQIIAGKVWAYGDLQARTRNTLTCSVEWNFHVAPFVRTSSAGDAHVYDPSLFDRPVTVDEWVLEMSDHQARVEFSGAAIYVMAQRGDGRLELPREFEGERARFVLELATLAAHPQGPLPFAHCPL